MTACLVYEERLWRNPEVRYAMEAVAGLLEIPWRSAVAGQPLASGEAPVFVGPGTPAPPDAAAVIPIDSWERWDSNEVRSTLFEGDPLLYCGRDLPSARTPRELPPSWLRSIAWLLTREEEIRESHRDEWNCFAAPTSRLHELGLLDRPLINLHARQLERRIRSWCEERRITPAHVPRWKDEARFAVALTHDVDNLRRYSFEEAYRLVRQARDLRSYAFRAGASMALRTLTRGARAGDPYWNFERWLGEEGRFGWRSSFFFCSPDPAQRHPYDPTYVMGDPVEFEGRRIQLQDLLRLLASRGLDIGLHGGYQSYQSSAELDREKRQIESASGQPVRGTRQHFLRFDPRTTWPAQEEAGFLYDSTLGYNEAIGHRAGIAAPFHPWHAERAMPLHLLELPLTVMDGALFGTWKLSASLAFRRIEAILAAVEETGGLAVLLWHPASASGEHFPGWWDCYRETLRLLAERRAWVASGAEIAQWWLEREKLLAAPAAG